MQRDGLNQSIKVSFLEDTEMVQPTQQTILLNIDEAPLNTVETLKRTIIGFLEM